MKIFFTLLILSIQSFQLFAQPSNDNCTNATTLTVNANYLCDQSLDNASIQIGECQNGYAGGSATSVWYRFNASSSSMILNYLQTTIGAFPSTVRVYGPNPRCVPGCTSAIYNQTLTGDPGNYIELNSLTIGANYLVQIEDGDPNGPSLSGRRFCIGVYTPAPNNSISNPLFIDACGTTFNGTTQGGYSSSGTGTSRSNFDNVSTTCSGCSSGNDVPYVINNDSWFTFCSGVSGTWNVTFNVGTCFFSGNNSGAQMSILTGTPTSLTNIGQNAPSPLRTGLSWTSGNFSISAGGCAYLVVDGFAGDACSYSYTLTGLSGGCVLLSTHISKFTSIQILNQVDLKWVNNKEDNLLKYTLEKGTDAINFIPIVDIDGVGDGGEYNYIDKYPSNGYNYYRLKITNYDGTESLSKMTVVYFEGSKQETISIYPNPITDEINLIWQQIGDGPVYINIKDFSGKEVYSEKIPTNEGINKISIISNNFPLGFYILKIQNEQNSKQTTFIKN